jgi:hypothetical protein
VRKRTENDAKSQRVLLNFGTLEKNKKAEEQEHERWLDNNNKPLRAHGRNEQQPGRILETVNSDNKKI